MGYRSEVYLKTTTEGWIMMKQLNDSIKEWEDRPLSYSEVHRTTSGNYKIEFHDIKWYDSYKQVQLFTDMLNKYEEEDIPYSFIRIGEEEDDIEHRRSYVDDMPWEIESFEPVVDVNDEEYRDYEKYADFTVMHTHPEDEIVAKSEHPDDKEGV